MWAWLSVLLSLILAVALIFLSAFLIQILYNNSIVPMSYRTETRRFALKEINYWTAVCLTLLIAVVGSVFTIFVGGLGTGITTALASRREMRMRHNASTGITTLTTTDCSHIEHMVTSDCALATNTSCCPPVVPTSCCPPAAAVVVSTSCCPPVVPSTNCCPAPTPLTAPPGHCPPTCVKVPACDPLPSCAPLVTCQAPVGPSPCHSVGMTLPTSTCVPAKGMMLMPNGAHAQNNSSSLLFLNTPMSPTSSSVLTK